MPSYGSFVLVVLLAFLAPVLRALVPALLVPAIVLEILFGVAAGPHGLGWATVDAPIQVFSDVGLAMLLFLAGLEIDLQRLRGRVAALAGAGFAVSVVLGLGAGLLVSAAGVSESPLLIAIILVATSLSVIIVPLKDAGETATDFGQLVIAAASVAEFGALILLALFFSGKRTGLETEAVHLSLFALVALAVGLNIGRGGLRGGPLGGVMEVLEGTTAQIRVRADFALVGIAVWLASELGLETILAAFTAGVIRGLWREPGEDPVRSPLEIASFGVFVPFFFIATGLQFDVGALFSSASSALRLPVLLLAILLVRSLPALLYRRMLGGRPMLAAGLLQATSLTFVVVAAQLGARLHLMSTSTEAALIGAGLLSVVIFPGTALALLRRARTDAAQAQAPAPDGASA